MVQQRSWDAVVLETDAMTIAGYRAMVDLNASYVPSAIALATVVKAVTRELVPGLIPSREIGVIICVRVLVDVICGRMRSRVAANVGGVIRSLIDPDVVDQHLRWKLQVLEVLSLETGRHAKVHDDSHGLFSDQSL